MSVQTHKEQGLPWFLRERVRLLVAQCIVEDREIDRSHERLTALLADGALTPYGLRLLAAVKLHRGEAAAAQPLLERSIAERAGDEDDHDRRVDRLMLAETLGELGEHDEAIRSFDKLIEERPEEHGPPAACHHGRAVAYERKGELDAALADYHTALATAEDYDAAHIRLDIARVLAGQGDRDGAIAVLEEGLQSDDGYGSAAGEVPYALARLHAAAGRHDDAAEALTKAAETARNGRAIRERARADEAFAALRTQGSFVAATREPAVDTSWLDAPPALARLRDSAELRELGVRFVSEAVGREGGDVLRARYAESFHLGTLWTDGLWSACQEIAQPLTLIARGPELPGPRHAGELTDDVCLYADLAAPEHVRIAPDAEFPAALFTRVPAEPAAVATAIRQLFLDVPRSVAELPGVCRAFMGYLHEQGVPNPYSGEIEPAGPHELERHFNFSPAADPLAWGSAYADDPWPDRMPLVQDFKVVDLSRQRRAQLRGAVATITRRTQFSRSHLGFEIHQPRGTPFYVWHLRYRPNPYPDTIERFNAAAGTSYPPELPADVVAALIGFAWLTVADLEAMVDDEDSSRAVAAWEVLAALRHNELAVTEQLRRWAAARDLDLDQRSRIAQLCLEYSWRALLEELALAEPDEGLRERMVSVLRDGLPETTFNHMGEPEGLYDNLYNGDEDDGDYDEDEDDDYDDEEDDS